jgi:hypothetical protein
MPNLHCTEQLVLQFREHRLTGNQGEDVLQLYTTLWYAWVSLSAKLDTKSDGKSCRIC